jgi:hypothetical protein
VLDVVALGRHPSAGVEIGKKKAKKERLYPDSRAHLASSERRSPRSAKWKDGDRGGSAEWEKPHERRKAKNRVLTSPHLLLEGLWRGQRLHVLTLLLNST